jgi:phage-related protein (TIGR01555 family)
MSNAIEKPAPAPPPTLTEQYARWRRARADSWYNLMTGLNGGENGVDAFSRLGFDFAPNARINDQQLEELYHHDWVVARICDLVPDEALRQGYEVTTEGDDDKDAVARLHARLDRMMVNPRGAEAWAWARLYGGGALLLGVDDDREMHEPLDEANIRSFDFVTTLDRRECFAFQWYRDAARPEFGEPELFRLARVTQAGTQSTIVHTSRLIRFHGVRTSRRKRLANASWGEGVVQRVWDDVRQFNGAFTAALTLLHDASLGVFSIEQLASLIAQDGQDALKARLEALELGRSVGRSIMLDTNEKYERVEANVLAGIPDVLDKVMAKLAAATQIPVTLLFGEAPAGLNATGDNDVRAFYDRVRSLQQNELRPKLQRIIRLLWRAQNGPTAGKEPRNWTIKFRPLYQLTEGEQADLRLKAAQADQIYLDKGVVTPEEVATSRFRPEGWSGETVINLEVRQAAMEADHQPEGAPGAEGAGTAPGVNRALPPGAQTPPGDTADSERRLVALGFPLRRAPGTAGAARADHESVVGRLDPAVVHGLAHAWEQASRRYEPDFRADAAGSSGVAIVLPVPADVAARLAVPDRAEPVNVAGVDQDGAAAGERVEVGVGDAVPAGMLHCTLAFLGTVDAVDETARVLLRAVVAAWAKRTAPIAGVVSGVGRFSAGPAATRDPVYATPSCPALAAAREDLVGTLAAVGLAPATAHGFVPHVTLTHVPAGREVSLVPLDMTLPVAFDAVGLWIGEAREAFALTGKAE